MRQIVRLTALAATLATLAGPPALAQQFSAGSLYDPGFTVAPLGDSQSAYQAPNPKAELAVGVRALKAKNYRAAIHSIGKVVDHEPTNIAAWRLLAVAYAGADKWRYSRHAYERVLKVAPNDVVSHAGRGEALLALNDPRAQEEAAWLRARAQACGDTCPDAAILKTLQQRGPFANAG